MNTLPAPTQLKTVTKRKPEFYLEDFLPIPKSAITMISASGGSGKTFLSIQIAIRMIKENPKHKVLLWLSEDDKGIVKHRADEILNKVLGSDFCLDNIDIIDDMPQHLNDANIKAYKELFVPYNLVVIDPLIAFYGGNENDNSQARYFMNLLNKAARDNLQSILVVHHSTKPTKDQESRARGASAFIDAIRLSYELENVEDNICNKNINVRKDNYGVKQIIGDTKVVKVLPYEVAYKSAKKIVKNQTFNISYEEVEKATDKHIEKENNLKLKGLNFE